MGRIRSISCLVAAALLGACAGPITSTGKPLDYLPSLAGDYFPLRSAAMGSTYHIYVRYPEDYAKEPTARYPVVYLLDGDSVFPMLAPEHLFLHYDDHIPDAVLVGIAYGSFAPPMNHREIDFGSRAADFERFLADELIPAVERRVRADPARRILVGQSFGANFVLYSAYQDPDLFWARIASNPSARMHQELLTEAPHSATRTDARLYLVSGTANNADGRQFALKLAERWQHSSGPWAFEEIDIPGGTHAADLPNAYRLALRRLFNVTPP
ncbi:MAG: alpha/beta hydrolase [Bacillota bacterium]